MTKIGFMSDLHIDSNQFGSRETAALKQLLKEERIDHLHLAGDLSNDFAHISQPFLRSLGEAVSLSFNLGNHDMLGMTEEEIARYDFHIGDFGRSQLISLAGWYDYSFVPEKSQEEHLRTKNQFWFDRRLSRRQDDIRTTQAILSRLDTLLDQADKGKDMIVALHFVPHRDFLYDHPYFQRFNAFLGSQAFHDLFVRYGVKEVIFGHLHHRHSPRLLDGIRYHMRPLGYVREWQLTADFFRDYPHYQIPQNYRLHKRYNAVRKLPEFQKYKEKHLAAELRDALTVIEI